MYKVTQEEIDSYKSRGSVKRGYINVLPSNGESVKTLNESDLKEFDILDDIYTPKQGIIGSIISKQLTTKLFKPSDIDLLDKEVDTYIGTTLSNNTIKYIPCGRYIIQKPEENKVNDKTYFEAFDYMVKFNKLYKSHTTYPCTAKDVLKDICEQVGVGLATETFANENFVIDSNVFVNNETCRYVLKGLCLLSGNYARIGRDNLLYLDFLTDSKQVINETDYTNKLNINNKFGPCNRVVLKLGGVEGENVTLEDKEAIEKDGVQEIVITDCPFTYTQELRQKAITELWNKLKGIEYYDFSTDYIARPYLDCGDSIQISSNSKLYNSYIQTHYIKYNGGLKSNMKATVDTKAETKYVFTPDMWKNMKRTEIVVNKALQEITATNKKVEDNNTQITEIKATTESITNRVSDVTETTDTITGELTSINKNVSELEQTVKGLKNTVTQQGGSNLLLNSSGLFDNEHWEGPIKTLTNTEIQNNFVAKACFNLQSGVIKQNIAVTNGAYYIGFKYQKNIELAKCEIKINGITYQLTENKLTQEDIYINVDDHNIAIEILSDTNDSCYIGDIIVVQGAKQEWSANMNEIYTSTVKIGIGLEITSNTVKTKLLANADGVRIVNTTNNKVVAEFTDRGMTTNELTANTSRIAGILIQEINNQTWISKL